MYKTGSGKDQAAVAFGFRQITVGAAASGLLSTDYTDAVTGINAVGADFSVEATNGLRYRLDGAADPTSAIGLAVAGGGSFRVEGIDNLRRLRWIRSGGADAVVNAQFYR